MNILVVVNSLNTGGIASALINMINACPSYRWTILPLKYDMTLQQSLPSNATFYRKKFLFNNLLSPFGEIVKNKNIASLLLKVAMSVVKKIIGLEKLVGIVSSFSTRCGKYDVAISYNNDIWYENGDFYGGSNLFVKRKVEAEKKLSWIHAQPDYIGLTKENAIKTYAEFDQIINVSKACEQLFIDVVPEFKKRCSVVYNFINISKMTSCIEKRTPYNNGKINIITVARIENRAKRIDKIVPIASKLKQEGFSFVWNIIGDGPDYENIKQNIEQENLNDVIKLWGEIKEPFSHLYYADLLVLTSEYEAYPMVICESLAMGTPVVCTSFPAANEMVENGINGFVVGMREEEIYLKLHEILADKDMLKRMKSPTSYNINEVALRQLINVLNQ